MQPQPVMGANQPAAGFLRKWMSITYGLCTIVTAPAEMGVRVGCGSQYVHPVVLVLAVLLVQFLAVIGLVVQPATHVVTGRGGLIGMFSLFLLFCGLLVYHLPRIAHLMKHQELEEYSESDGLPLPFMERMPHATWTTIRIFYEPAIVFLGAVALYFVHILEPFALVYLIVVAFMMSAKQSVRLYNDWLRRREVADMAYLLGLAKRVAAGEPLRKRDMMFLPKGLPPTKDERERLARTLSPEFATLITPLA